MIPTTLCWANLSLRLREPPPQVARTSASGCANLRLRLREPPPPVAQLPFPKPPPQVAQTSASGCANLRLKLRKPPPQVAQTSASGCANLRLRLRKAPSQGLEMPSPHPLPPPCHKCIAIKHRWGVQREVQATHADFVADGDDGGDGDDDENDDEDARRSTRTTGFHDLLSCLMASHLWGGRALETDPSRPARKGAVQIVYRRRGLKSGSDACFAPSL